MSQLNVDNIRNRTGSNGGPNFPSGITVAVGQTAYIHGNLQVDGTETIINTETLNVSDKTVGIGSTTNASNTTADGAGIEVFASSSQVGNNKTLTWGNTANSWEFGPNDVGLKVGTGVTINSSGVTITGVLTATSFKGDGSQLSGIDATAIQTGNTSVQTVDTGSDGHVKMTTEGGERVRIGPAGQIGLGGANYGTEGQVLTSAGSGGAPSWAAIPAGGNVISGIASGAIAFDKCMALAHDGKILQVGLLATPKDPAANIGNEKQFQNSNSYNMEVLYEPDADRFLNVFSANNQLRYNVCGFQGNNPVNSNSAVVSSSFGNPNSNVGTDNISACYDTTNNKCFVVFHDNTYSDRARCIVGTMTPDESNQEGSMAWGSPVDITTGGGDYVYCCFDSTNNKIIVTYRNRSNNYLQARVGAISGNSITFGSELTITTDNSRNTACVHDVSVNKILITWENVTQSQKMYGVVGTISGNSMTFGTIQDLNDGSTGQDLYTSMVYDPDGQQTLALYKGSSSYPQARVFKISGTTITGYTKAQVYGGASSHYNITYDTQDNRAIVFYEAQSNSNAPRVVPITISGTSLSVGTFFEPRTGDGQSTNGAVDNKGNALVCYRANAGHMRRVLVSTISGNIANAYQYVGFADTSYTNGQTVTIRTVGNTSDNFSGLTTSSVYYVQGNGTINTSWDSTYFASFASNTPIAGRAINSTTLQIFEPR